MYSYTCQSATDCNYALFGVWAPAVFPSAKNAEAEKLKADIEEYKSSCHPPSGPHTYGQQEQSLTERYRALKATIDCHGATLELVGDFD